ncbi:unnamed protein product [Effrenium voratum]|uniref:Uncharacterized protein n=1 Tax=Effrenium voratum TaxID=2562239 RepID=A0AA36JEU6_9DINO|nr:unnamed protein product [Effrenium voratum]
MAQAAVTAMARSLQHMAEQAPTDRAEHMRSLVTLLASTPVEPEEVDQVAAELSTDPLGFSAEERDMILQAIRTREAAAPKTRRAAQDYSRLDRFLFASDWQALRNMASARSRAASSAGRATSEGQLVACAARVPLRSTHQTVQLEQQGVAPVQAGLQALVSALTGYSSGHTQSPPLLRNLQIFSNAGAVAGPSVPRRATTESLALTDSQRTLCSSSRLGLGQELEGPATQPAPSPQPLAISLSAPSAQEAKQAGPVEGAAEIALCSAEASAEDQVHEMEAALRKKAGLPATSRKNKADPEQGLQGRGMTRPAAKHELKRPAAKLELKRPAASHDPNHQEASRGMKRPAAREAKDVSANLKRPAAKAKAESKPPSAGRGLPEITERQRLLRKPEGCGGCRNRPGCCPSCWIKRGLRKVQ